MNKNIIKRLDATKSIVGLSRSTIYAMMKSGDFPKSISLGPRSIGWLESDLQAWIDSRIAVTKA